jgi:hypothetical protein
MNAVQPLAMPGGAGKGLTLRPGRAEQALKLAGNDTVALAGGRF